MKHISKLLGTVAFVGLVTSARPAFADKTFGAGSLIIPPAAVYQNDCGAVSMYGLVYQLLRANQWLITHSYTKIEIYYAYKETKASPNRCTPTNQSHGPTYPGGPAAPVPHDHAKYIDGCDFEISDTDPANPPVKLVDTYAPFGADANITTNVTTGRTAAGTNRVWPGYASIGITDANAVNTVRYGGAPFVIDSTDADTVIKLIRGDIVAQDNGVNIDFSPFRIDPTSCSFGSTVGGNVAIHRAMTSFIAPNPKVFDDPPPRLALLARNRNQSPVDGYPGGGGAMSPGSNSQTGRVDNLILQKYLARAGLNFVGAQGCPVGGAIATDDIASCGGVAKVGEIYDLFDFKDITDGRLDDMVGGVKTYKMLWAPHWQSKGFGSDGAPTPAETTGLNNIAAYLDGANGLMAECASIETIEGLGSTRAVTTGQVQSCVGTGSTCSGATNDKGFRSNLPSRVQGPQSNCTDPDLVNTNRCYYFSYPGDPYVQVADYRWSQESGRVEDFLPGTGSIYRPGVKALVSGVASLDKTRLSVADARTYLIKSDHVTRGFKDNDEDKSALLYLGGHDMSGTVAGSKVVLQTLLQLGTPDPGTTLTEVARSTPIIGEVGLQFALVQGTYEQLNPMGDRTVALADPDVAAFEFPYMKGHLRAITVSELLSQSTATAFTGLDTMFDGAFGIPTTSYAACAEFDTTCRTVFTTTIKDCRPGGAPCVRRTLNAANGPAIGALIGPGLTPANQEILVQRVIAGIPSGGSRIPALGGVDRSTVALIPPSTLANAARPTMIYVGAADGMLHAFCATDDGACTVGKELWAYMPRNQLALVQKNEQRIDGSPRVADMLIGDGTPGGAKSFRTVLVFQTASGDAASTTANPAVYALDVTNPFDPKVLWEHATVGRGLSITTGKLASGKFAAFVQTNNGTGVAGTTVTAIDIETGLAIWSPVPTFDYGGPRLAAHNAIPTTGIPGGAVGLDRDGTGTTTDVFFSTIKGEIFQLNADTGVNRHAAALFSFSEDYKPFGAAPTLYSDGIPYVVAASGGYTDLDSTPQWSSPTVENQLVAVSARLGAQAGPLDETATPPSVKFATNLGVGRFAFAQVRVVGTEMFLTTDTSDVNAATYGTGTASTGHAYQFNAAGETASGNAASDAVVIFGGAGSLASSGTTMIASSSSKAQVLANEAASTVNPNPVNGANTAKLTRRLWLRTL